MSESGSHMDQASSSPDRWASAGRALQEAAARFGELQALAVPEGGVWMGFGELARQAELTARGLIGLGLRKRDVACIWAESGQEWVVFQFATAMAGAVLLPLNPEYRSEELGYILRHSRAKMLMTMEGIRQTDTIRIIRELVPESVSSDEGVISSALFPDLKSIVLVGSGSARGMTGAVRLLERADMVSGQELESRCAAVGPDDPALLPYASGTAGYPKGVVLSHRAILTSGLRTGENQGLARGERFCLALPLSHTTGCAMGILAGVTHGASIVIPGSYSPYQIFTLLEKEECSALFASPAVYESLLLSGLCSKFATQRLRTGMVAGSSCPPGLLRKINDVLGIPQVTVSYGLSETAGVLTQTLPGDPENKRLESVGRPIRGMEVRVVEPGTSIVAPAGVQGEICCRGESLMSGYHRMEMATAAAMDDGWLHTGDLGFLDDDGYLTVSGRIKDIIVADGENVYPREVEEFLSTMEGILDVQIVGVPRIGREEVGAFIILKEGFELTEDDVREFCRSRIASFKVPAHIAFIEKYPLSMSGKIQRQRMRELAAELFAGPEKGADGR
jgi:fatty-acyl-CoA synthase